MIGIYKITNAQNGKFYIGSSVDIQKRWREHKLALRKNRHHNPYLQRAWNKQDGIGFQFDVLEICETGNLIYREQSFIDTLSPEYNLCKIAGTTKGRLPPSRKVIMSKFIVKVKGLHKGAFEVEAVDIYNVLAGTWDGVSISVEAAQHSVQATVLNDPRFLCAEHPNVPSVNGACPMPAHSA